MVNPNANPIVSFHRDGQEITLGTGGAEDKLMHIFGSTGLGLAPIEHSLTERIAGDGAILRGIRYGVRDIYLPLLIHHNTFAEATRERRRLYRHFAPHLGEIEIRVEDPATGTTRAIKGYLKDGLDGDFSQNFHGTWQTLGLTFTCPDPWWLGEEKIISLKVNPGVKPFISESIHFFPVVLTQSSVKGSFTVTIDGDGEIYPVWDITGPGEDLTITNKTTGESIVINHTLRAGEKITIDTARGTITPDLWEKIPLTSRFFPLQRGNNKLDVTMVGSTTATIVNLIYRERFMEGI